MAMNKKQFLASLSDVYCRLACTRHGVGLVAIRRIPQGTDPFKNCDPEGDVLEIWKKNSNRTMRPRRQKNSCATFARLNGVYFVPDYGIDAIDKSYFLNHSTEPNMTTADKGESFFASRDIEIGEELTINYDLYHDARHFERR